MPRVRTFSFTPPNKSDTLSAIAGKTQGDANRPHEIFESSKPTLSHPEKDCPGRVLRVPRVVEA